jgi:glucose dehydrogenase
MKVSLRKILAGSVCATACLLAAMATPGMADENLQKMSADASQWVMPLGNYSSQRYSTLKQINTSTAKNLHPVWTFSTGVLRGHEGGPLVIGDMMYMSTPYPNTVFALDLNQGGRIVWKYEPHQDPNVIPVMCCDTVNRGVAYADGMIFLQSRLVGEDRRSGQG